MLSGLAAVAAFILMFAVWIKTRRRRRRGGPKERAYRPGAGAAGAVYELLNQDKRKAIEIIVEQRAEAVDPERARDNPPDLEKPKV